MRSKFFVGIILMIIMLTGAVCLAEMETAITGGTEGLIIEGTTVTGYTGTPPEVIIPEGVTEIGANAFYDNQTVTSVVVPEGVTVIASDAFNGCINMSNLELPSTLKEIGELALGETLSLKGIILPDGLETIGSWAFAVSGIERLVIPDTVTRIGMYAFNECTNLKEASLPEELEFLGEGAFASSGVEKIFVPGTIASVEAYLFDACHDLKKVTIGEGLATIGVNMFRDCTSLEKVTLPSTVVSMETGAFMGCTNLKEITLSDHLTTIASFAFSNCQSLEKIDLPDSLRIIDTSAFAMCKSLTELYIPGGVSALHQGVINQSGIRNIYIPESVININDIIIEGPNDLTVHCYEYSAAESWAIENGYEVRLMDGKSFSKLGGSVALSDFAMYEGENLRLKSVVKPDSRDWQRIYTSENESVAVIDEDGIITAIASGTTRLTMTIDGVSASCVLTVLSAETDDMQDFVVTDGVLTAYTGDGIDVVIPEGLNITAIGSFVFENNPTIHSVVIPEGVTEIGGGAFHGCRNLRKVELPSTITDIGGRAFQSCTTLESINFPEGLLTISEYAFHECRSIEYIDFPESLQSIGQFAFHECFYLKRIDLPRNLTSLGGAAFSRCLSASGKIVIPKGVTVVPGSCFASCDLITGVELHDGITELGAGAFSGCNALNKIDLPENLTSIGYGCFYDCQNLEALYVPDSTEFIGGDAFGLCYDLRELRLPEKITVETYRLFSFTGLSVVKIPEGVTELEFWAIAGDNVRKIILPSTLKTIGGSSCTNMPLLKEIVVPDGVTSIGETAFSGNSGLERVYIPASVTEFGPYIFGRYNAYDYDYPTIYVTSGSAAEAWAMENGYDIAYTDADTFSARGGSITLDEGLSLPAGGQLDLYAQIFPDATGFGVSYSSDNTSVLTIDENGRMTGIASGTAKVTVKAGDVYTTTTVIVYTPVTDFSISESEIYMLVKDTAQLSIGNILPTDNGEKLAFETTHRTIADVDADGTITAKSAGTAYVYVESAMGVRRECAVHVYRKLTDVTFEKGIYGMDVGESVQLRAIVNADGDECVNQFVTFASADETIATVNAKGVVTLLKEGETTITATLANGASDICRIISGIAPESVSLSDTALTLNTLMPGRDVRLSAELLPADCYPCVIEWTSSNPSVVAVDATGVLHAQARGKATITATACGITAECVVTVKEMNTLLLPNALTVLAEEAFMGNTSVEAVAISEGVKSIPANAFAGCSQLKYAYIPASVTEIADTAFEGGVIIITSEGSNAQTWARANGFEVYYAE